MIRKLAVRLSALALAVVAFSLPAVSQHDHGSMIGASIAQNGTRGTVIHLKSGTETVDAEIFLSMGQQRASSPALILIPEWWGLNDWVRDQARAFAAQGYTVVTLDIYRGKTATDMETAHELSRALPHDRVLRDLEGALNYIHTAAGASAKVGVVGWCMGGGLALEFAIAEPKLNAIVVNYGTLPTDDAALTKINAPILGNFGGLDKGITPDSVATFEKQMKALDKSVDLKVYPDAGHAFENETNKTGYNAADTADAKRRTILFLNAQLKR